jgi:hypothetical protein
MMKTHVLSFVLLGLSGILTVRCEKNSPTGIVDDALVGRWTLSSVQIVVAEGYGDPMNVEEFGTAITFVFGRDGAFLSDYVYEDGATSHAGTWITLANALIIHYTNGGKASGRYSVSDTEFRFSIIGILPNTGNDPYYVYNPSHINYILTFMRE